MSEERCADCGEGWKLMCEPVSHADTKSGEMLRLCHKCHRERLDQERTERRIASQVARVPRENGVLRDATAGGCGQVSDPMVE